MFYRIARALWGDFSAEDAKRFGMLSLTFLFLIGSYWLMRPLKDGLFLKIVGKSQIPTAKILSWVFVVALVLFYQKLVDLVAKHKLFYILCAAYAVVFLGIAYALTLPGIGLANTTPDKTRILGWVIYLSIESFGSLLVALFWSFVASVTDTASAKKGFPLIIAGAQIGSIAGPALGNYAEVIGLPTLMATVAITILMVPVMIALFVRMFPAAGKETGPVKDKKPTGIVEGLRLLGSKPYLLGILGVATLYEVIGTILDYQMKVAADDAFTSAAAVTSFLSKFGMTTNVVSLVFALLGSSFFIRRFGLTFCLVAFPVTVAGVVLWVYFAPSLWVFFGAMVAVKALSYALNNPCKEIMYIPTSKDVKFKAKSWIDSFGGRTAKAAGSGINSLIPIVELATLGSLISLGIIGVWLVVAYYVGRTNDNLVKENKIIG
jgi:ATP:ADP antiporter, AAA family